MTPQQKREMQQALRECDHHFQQRFHCDVPGQLSGSKRLGEDRLVETWRSVLRAIKTLDDVYEAHQRMRGSVENAVNTLEAKQ